MSWPPFNARFSAPNRPAPGCSSLAPACSKAAAISTRDEPQKAEQSLEAARQMFIDAGDRAGAAAALNSLGTVLSDQQDITPRAADVRAVAGHERGDRRSPGDVVGAQQSRDPPQGPGTARRGAPRPRALARAPARDRRSQLDRDLAQQHRRGALRRGPPARGHDLLQGVARDLPRDRRQAQAWSAPCTTSPSSSAKSASSPTARAGLEESLATRAEIGDKRGQVMGRVELGMVLLAARRDRRRAQEPGGSDPAGGRDAIEAGRSAGAFSARRDRAGGRRSRRVAPPARAGAGLEAGDEGNADDPREPDGAGQRRARRRPAGRGRRRGAGA